LSSLQKEFFSKRLAKPGFNIPEETFYTAAVQMVRLEKQPALRHLNRKLKWQD
jgi:hypothetical protein